MIEDVKLMAKFDGITDRFCMCDRHKYAHKLSTCMPDLIPNYPKDMNSLLGVMDKIRGLGWVIEIFGDGELNIWPGCNYDLKLHEHSFVNFSDLPTVLFPLPVEAIKQIPLDTVAPACNIDEN